MRCKICHKNETDNPTGMCWKCLNEKHHQKFFGYCPEHGRWESDTGNGCPFCNQYAKNTFIVLLSWHIIVYLTGILVGLFSLEINLCVVLLISFIIGYLSASMSKFLAKKIWCRD